MSMRRVDRYIVSTVASAMLMVLLVVLSLDFVFGFIAEMEDLKNDYQALQALAYVMTTAPRRLYDYLPLGAFMGCLIGLGNLASSSELVVVRAAGVSTKRIVWSAMKPALVVVCFGLLLGEYVAPLTEKIAQSNKAIQQGASSNIATNKGLWHREGNTYMHFNAVQPNGVLHGVSMQEYDDNRNLVLSLFAKRAIFQRGNWLLEEVEETVIGSEGAYTASYSVKPWDTALSPSLLSLLVVKPDNLSISGLFSYTRYLQDHELNAGPYQMSFWKKVLRPLTTAVLVLVAISFVFGPLRSVTVGFRVFCGIIVGLVFKYAQDLLGPSSLVFGFHPILASIIPIAVCLCFGLFLIRRAS